jgi:parallel beta-helix repeat protein
VLLTYAYAEISGNTISHNGGWGLYLDDHSKATVLHNNFIDNGRTPQAVLTQGSTGTFSNAAPVGGNYWSDWTSPDADGDGFVDAPYAIDVGVQDALPWAVESGWDLAQPPIAPTITWTDPTPITYGTELTATQLNAAADVPGVFAYTPPAGTVLSVGTHQALRADFAPTDATRYTTATKTVYVDVAPATLTVTALPQSMVYGTSVASLTFSYDGFMNGDTSVVVAGTPSCTTTATSNSSVGDYPITCDVTGLSATNYSFAPVAGTLHVRPATPAITVTGGPFAYDGTQHAATMTATGVGGALVSGSFAVTYTPGGSATPTDAATYAVSAAFTSSDPNYQNATASGSITIGPATTSVLYAGDQSVTIPSAFNLAAQRTGPAACPISYTLDTNPLTGVAGAYALGSGGAVSTGKWLEGVYNLTVTLGGNANCLVSTDQTTLAVSSAGDVALGAGWYTLAGAGRVSFAFTVGQIPKKTPIQYAGMFSLMNSGKWWISGPLTTYTTMGATGTAAGTGRLYWWNQSLNGRRGGWVLASSKVTYTISFIGSTAKSKGSFGIQVNYKPVPPQPSSLPNSALTVLQAGVIKMK